MDAVDAVARAAASYPVLLAEAGDLVGAAAGLIRDWKFAQAYKLLDQLRQLAGKNHNGKN
jgi:hypothetical protein